MVLENRRAPDAQTWWETRENPKPPNLSMRKDGESRQTKKKTLCDSGRGIKWMKQIQE